MNFVQRCREAHQRRGQVAAGHTDGCVYSRGAYSVDLTPRLGRTVFVSNLDGAARVQFGEIDLKVAAADLVLNTAVVEPALGDRIALTLNGQSLTFEVQIPRTLNEPAWRYADQERTILRIHCKRV